MNRVNLYINSKNAKTEWSILFEDDSVTNLMTPAPLKKYIKNQSPLQAGTEVATSFIPKESERNLNLSFILKAKNLADFYIKYSNFCNELKKGFMTLKIEVKDGNTAFDITYNLLYLSCQQYMEFNGRLAKFKLKMNEPNPEDRVINHSKDIVL